MFDPIIKKSVTFAAGEMAEWSIAAVLKTVEGQTSGGSNPSFSASSRQKASSHKKPLLYTTGGVFNLT